MVKYKTKTIQTDLGIFRHNQAYPEILRAYSKPCVTLEYLEPYYIQNPDIFRTRSIFRILAYTQPDIFRIPVYSERWHIQNPRHIQSPVKHL